MWAAYSEPLQASRTVLKGRVTRLHHDDNLADLDADFRALAFWRIGPRAPATSPRRQPSQWSRPRKFHPPHARIVDYSPQDGRRGPGTRLGTRRPGRPTTRLRNCTRGQPPSPVQRSPIPGPVRGPRRPSGRPTAGMGVQAHSGRLPQPPDPAQRGLGAVDRCGAGSRPWTGAEQGLDPAITGQLL